MMTSVHMRGQDAASTHMRNRMLHAVALRAAIRLLSLLEGGHVLSGRRIHIPRPVEQLHRCGAAIPAAGSAPSSLPLSVMVLAAAQTLTSMSRL